jgi:NADPH-dependent 2,4-dienoyl-CoA reductase/sulfur reductase-like enzyme
MPHSALRSSSQTDNHLVVVGASLAGLRAVEAARAEGFDGRITLIGDESRLPYDRPSLSKDLLQPDGPVDPLGLAGSEKLDAADVELALGQKAISLDVFNRTIETSTDQYRYTSAVLATGSSAVLLPGLHDLEGVMVMRTFEDALAVRAALDDAARTVIIGGGFIGAEVASAARKRDLAATIVEAAPAPLVRAVGPEMGEALATLHERFGTNVHCRTSVVTLEGHRHVEAVVLSDGQRLPADLVIVGIGSTPNVSWLEASGLEIDNGVVCDSFLRTSSPDVFAAGDIAHWHNALFDRTMRIEHYTSAGEQGARAARNAVNPESMQTYETVPYFWSDWYDHRIQFVGVLSQDVIVASGNLADSHFVALYRDGGKIVGALTLNGQRQIMKYRRMISERCSFDDALAFATSRQRAKV